LHRRYASNEHQVGGGALLSPSSTRCRWRKSMKPCSYWHCPWW